MTPLRLLALLAASSSLLIAGCGSSERQRGVYADSAARPAHIHGLAVVDGDVLAAAHNGLWRIDAGRATRIGAVRDDLMGFTVAGEGRYLASGHPAHPEAGRPPHLGLIESVDGGRSWKPLSLSGEADFHALAVSGDEVAGYDAGRLLRSSDGGMTWNGVEVDSHVLSLAMRPERSAGLLAGTAAGVQLRRRGRWKTLLPGEPALVVWPTDRRMLAVAVDGEISTSDDAGKSWRRAGHTPGAPVAASADSGRLLVATESGAIVSSASAGKTWTTLISAP